MCGCIGADAGSARIAGFDITEQPLEAKRRLGYLPEGAPSYPEMTPRSFLEFVAAARGMRPEKRRQRLDEIYALLHLERVLEQTIDTLSKGYKRRVGLAQAIIHNPEVLILDEPTSGLDPKQINETRELIKSLAGEHTIILSTHILPEVEAVCEKVIIIDKGRLVATDSVEHLKTRGSVGSAIQVQVDTAGMADAIAVRQRLEQVPGVSKVLEKVTSAARFIYEVESLQGQNPRPDVARAIVNAGWNLMELKSTTLSLEDIFLELTGSHEHHAA
jgi:ABC-2 type transport system ATP-binding protein